MKYSISAERMWQRCQRQYFFSEIMANTRASDAQRNEAQFLKSIKTAEEWVGIVVHKIIQNEIMPVLVEGRWPKIKLVLERAFDFAKTQYDLSAAYKYHKVEEAESEEDYYILWENFFEGGEKIPNFDDLYPTIAKALINLLSSQGMRSFLIGREGYITEKYLSFKLDGVTVMAQPDLCMPAYDKEGLDIIDWKVALHASNYNYQVAVYALATSNNNTLPYLHFAQKRVRGYVINLLESDPAIALNAPYLIDEEALIRTENLLFERLQRVRLLRGDKKYHQLDIGDFELADSEGTCATCNWKQLCAEIENARSPKSLPGLKPKSTQLALSLDDDW